MVVVPPPATPRTTGIWRTVDLDGDPGQEPGDHRGGEKLRDPAQAQEADGDQDVTDEQGGEGHQVGVPGGAHRRHRPTPAARTGAMVESAPTDR